MNRVQPFNPARADGESQKDYKVRRAQQNQVCKAAVRMAGVAWPS